MIEQLIAWLKTEIKSAKHSSSLAMSISEKIEFDAEANALERALHRAEQLKGVHK